MIDVQWQQTPPDAPGWYWRCRNGETHMEPVHVAPRPGHSYLAIHDEPNGVTGKREFLAVTKTPRDWWMMIEAPLPPNTEYQERNK